MNFGLAFSYLFQEKDWFRKLLIPSLCMLIPFIGWLVALGWALKIAENIISGSEELLPELNFGNDLLRGLFAFLISFVYSLPVTIISSISGWFGNWSWFGGDVGTVFATLFGGFLGLIAFVLGILASFFSLGAIANYVAKQDLGAAFRLNEVAKLLRTNLGDWFIVALGSVLAIGLIGPLGTVACIVGIVLTMTYGFAVTSHLLGQAYLRSK